MCERHGGPFWFVGCLVRCLLVLLFYHTIGVVICHLSGKSFYCRLLLVVVCCYLSAISSICQISFCLLSDSITMMTRNRKYISSEWNPCTNIWILNGILAHFQDEEGLIWLQRVGCWSLDVGCWSLATVFLCGRVSEPPLRICCCLLYRVASAYLLLFPLSNFLLYFTLFSSLKMIISCREQISLWFLWHLVPVKPQI